MLTANAPTPKGKQSQAMSSAKKPPGTKQGSLLGFIQRTPKDKATPAASNAPATVAAKPAPTPTPKPAAAKPAPAPTPTPKPAAAKTASKPTVAPTPDAPSGLPSATKRPAAAIACDSDEEETGISSKRTNRRVVAESSDEEWEPEEAEPEKVIKTPASVKSTPGSSVKRPAPHHGSSTAKKPRPGEKRKDSTERRYEFLVDIRDKEKRRPGDDGYDPNTLYIPAKQWSEFTEFERQYWEIKKEHWDTIVFFKKGKFYELYERDADIGLKEFDLKMTDRVNMKMVGVPEKSFPTWASKFIALGYKVARVDEAESMLEKEMREKKEKAKGTPAKKIIQRELHSILTAGTLTGDMVVDEMSTFIMAVKEDEATGVFGAVFCDAATGEFNLVQFQDDAGRTMFETLLVQISPKELVLEKNGVSEATKRIIKNVLKDPIINWRQPQAQFWDAQTTRDQLEFGKYFAQEGDSEPSGKWPAELEPWTSKDAAMSALGGLVSYLASLKLDRQLLSQGKFKTYDPLRQGKSMLLDGQTLANLDILRNDQGGLDGSLYGLLNQCNTPMGKRLLMRWLCHPLRHAADINDRLDAIEDLQRTGLIHEIELNKIPDLERLLSRIHSGTCGLPDFLLTLNCFTTLKDMVDRCANRLPEVKSKSLRKVLSTGLAFPDLAEPLEFFRTAFDHDLARTEGHVVPRSGVYTEYDEAKAAVDDIEKQLNVQLRTVRANLSNPNIQYRHIGNEKYQLEIPAATKVPADFILKSQTKAVKRYWNKAIEKLVKPLAEAQATYAQIQSHVYDRTLERFCDWYDQWSAAVDCVAQLDCLLSLARASLNLGEPSCRPVFVDSDEPVLELEAMRHPCFARDYIPNDTQLGGDKAAVMLLTGPNMGGKSTLLRQMCVAVIMAQIGCFVPANACRLTPVDRIFTRIGAHDNIVAGQSTFMVELKETANILRHATRSSLVILDELGRGTSTFDGYAIAYAVLRHIVDKVQCRTAFATHYHMLCDEVAGNQAVALNHMSCVVDDEKRDVTFLYKLADGVCPKSHGMNVANMAGVARSVVIRAEEKATEFEHSAPALSAKAYAKVQAFKKLIRLATDGDAAAIRQLRR